MTDYTAAMTATAPPFSLPSSQAPLPLDAQLSYRLHLIHKLSDAASSDAYLADCGLPLGEGRCLAAIGAFAPLSVVELGLRANLNKGQASRAAQSLASQGLVHKTAHDTDGRGVVLTLTEAGQAMHQRVMALIERRNQEIFGCLTAAEQQQLSDMLARLIEHARPAAAAPASAEPA